MSNTKNKNTASKSQRKKCNLCCSELDFTEREFYPCPCEYQVCTRCFRDIKAKKAVCPGCKSVYKSEKTFFVNGNRKDEVSKYDDKNKLKKNDKKPTTVVQNTISRTSDKKPEATLSEMFKGTDLTKLRVIQKQCVYVIGLSPELADEKTLYKQEYFGQYGRVEKIVVNRHNVYYPVGTHGACYSAYITYTQENDASVALLAIDQFNIHDRTIRASYGTTKYCTVYLRNQTCTNSDCFFLHSIKKESETCLKDDMQNNKNFFHEQQRIAVNQIRDHVEQILKVAKEKKIKPVFPSAATIKEKIQFHDAKDKAVSISETSVQSDNPEKDIESLNQSKVNIESETTITRTGDQTSQTSSFETQSILSNSLGISNWEELKRDSTQPESMERSESTRSKLTDVDIEREFDHEFPPLEQQVDDSSKKPKALLIQQNTPVKTKEKPEDSKKEEVSDSLTNSSPEPKIQTHSVYEYNMQNCKIGWNDDFELPRQQQDLEEYFSISQSIQDYLITQNPNNKASMNNFSYFRSTKQFLYAYNSRPGTVMRNGEHTDSNNGLEANIMKKTQNNEITNDERHNNNSEFLSSKPINIYSTEWANDAADV